MTRFACLGIKLLLLGIILGCGEDSSPVENESGPALWLAQGEEARQKGDYRQGIALFNRAGEFYRNSAETSGKEEDWEKVASCLNQIGWDHMVYFGEFAQARAKLLEAETVALEHLSKDNRQNIRQRHNFAVLNYYENRLDEALELNQSLLALRQSLPGDRRREIAATHNNLGLVYRARGELTKANVHYQRSLNLKKDALGEDHLDLASSYLNLGQIYLLLGEYKAGVTSLGKAHMLRTKHMQPGHPSIGASGFTYGKALLDQGKAEEASAHIEQAIRIQKAAYGEQHPHTAHSTWESARVLVERGVFEEAEAQLQYALTVFKQSFGEGNYHIADNLHYLGWLYWKWGRFEERVLGIFRKLWPFSRITSSIERRGFLLWTRPRFVVIARWQQLKLAATYLIKTSPIW